MIGTPSNDVLAIGTKSDAGCAVAYEIRQLADLAPARNFPGPQGTVRSGRRQHLAVGRERQRIHRLSVSLEPAKLLSGCRFPKTNSSVEAAGGEHLAVRRKSDAFDAAVMAAKAANLFSGVSVPQACQLIVAHCGE